MGGWWGTKTVLSEHPRLFWLQQHSDSLTTTTKTTYYQYPSASDKELTISPLVVIQNYAEGKVQVGSDEGKVRSHATYNYVEWQKSDGTSEKLFTDGYKPNGTSFSTEKNIDFKIGDKIVASINLPASTSGKENVLSVGDGIAHYGNGPDGDGYAKHNIHTYWDGTNLEIGYVFESGYGPKTLSGIDANNPVVLTFSKEGVEVKNEKAGSVSTTSKEIISSSELQKAYFPALTDGTVDVGSQEGDGRSHAVYHSIKVLDSANKVKSTVISTDFNPNGEKFIYSDVPVDFNNDDKLVVNVTLPATTNNTKENILSVGKDIYDWYSHKRIHLYLNGNTIITSYTSAETGGFTGNENIDISSFDKTKPITIEISKSKGVVFSQEIEISGSTMDEKYFEPITVEYAEGQTGDILFDTNNGDFKVVESGGKAIAEKITTTVEYTEKVDDANKQVYIASNISKASNSSVVSEEGHFMGYADETTRNEKDFRLEADCGIFVDRMIDFIKKPKVVQWNLGHVDETTGECTLSLTMPYTISDGMQSDSDHTYYLTATNSVVHGLKDLKEDPTKYNYKDESSVKADAVDLSAEISDSNIPDNAKWKLIPLSVYNSILGSMKEESNQTLDLTYLLKDPDFTRDNGELEAWTAEGTLGDGKLQIGHDQYYKTSTTSTTYDHGAMRYDDAERSFGRYFDVSIQNGGHGTFSQKVNIYRSGWYVVECQGKSNAKARLYAQYNSTKVNTPLVTLTGTDETELAQQSQWPYYYTYTKYNACVEMNDVNIGKTDKYANSVRIYIGDQSLSATNPGILTIGVDVPEQNGIEGDLTIFDSFRLLYGGISETPDLILDENNTNLDYLDQTIHKYDQSRLHLVRTFTKGAWNTIVLPVNLNQAQFQEMFGDDARLAYLKEIKEGVVRFYTVNRDDEEGVFLKAYMPYIIKVNVSQGSAPSFTEKLTRRDLKDGSYDWNVTAKENHFVVDGVTLAVHQNESKNYYDFADGKFADKANNYDYCVVATQEGNGAATYNGKTLTSYGTLCMTYSKDDNGKGQFFNGRPQLSDGNSYYFKNNTMWLRKKGVPYGLLGLRCWFVYDDPTSVNANPTKLSISINGIDDETTNIDDINVSGEPILEGKYAHAVYNMNGQLVSRDAESLSSLPAGMYIVNGRKVMIK